MFLTLRKSIKWSKGDLYFIMLVAWYTTRKDHVYCCFGLTEMMEPPTTSLIFISAVNEDLMIALLSY